MTTPDSTKHFSRDLTKVPAAALQMVAGEFIFGSNGENAKTAPIKMVARTGKPIEHWYWGNVVHDLDGMNLHKGKLPIDYCHDSREVMGYLSKFEKEPGDDGTPNLVTSGALVPFKDSDRVAEVLHKSAQGVPYEASIDFCGPTAIEEVSPGASVAVNGYQFTGPGIVIRQWNLRGVAVCPYGADMNTNSEFSGDDAREFPVTLINNQENNKMSKDKSKLEEQTPAEVVEETPAAVEATPETPAEVVEETPAAVETDETPTADDSKLTPAKKECKRFVDRFGPEGAAMWSNGMSYGDALEKHCTELTAENAALTKRLEQAKIGESDPLEFQSDAERQEAAASDAAEMQRLVEAFKGDEKRAKAAFDARRNKKEVRK